MARTEQLYHIHAGSWVSNFIKLLKLQLTCKCAYLIDFNVFNKSEFVLHELPNCCVLVIQ